MHDILIYPKKDVDLVNKTESRDLLTTKNPFLIHNLKTKLNLATNETESEKQFFFTNSFKKTDSVLSISKFISQQKKSDSV